MEEPLKIAESLEAALETAAEQQIPALIGCRFLETNLEGEARALIQEDKLVYYNISILHPDIDALTERFGLVKFRACLLDEHGNVLADGLKTSDDIHAAYGKRDELAAALAKRMTEALAQGNALLADGKHAEAVQALKAFAFAAGSDDADSARKAFAQAAAKGDEQLQALLTGWNADTATPDQIAAMTAQLQTFAAQWPCTPAAREARKMLALLHEKAENGGGSK